MALPQPSRAQARAFACSGAPTTAWQADRGWQADPFLSLLEEFLKPVPDVVLDWRGGDVRLPAPHIMVEGRAQPVQGMSVPAPGAPAPVPPNPDSDCDDMVECMVEVQDGNGEKEAMWVTPTAKLYFESNAFKRLPKRKRVGPWAQRFAGAVLERRHGYGSLAYPRNKRNIRRAPSTMPSLCSFPWIPYRTDAVLRLQPGLCCGHAAIQHATGATLEVLGLAPLPEDTRMIFSELQASLVDGAKQAGRPRLFTLATSSLHIRDMVRSDAGGVFIVHTYHLHSEDSSEDERCRLRISIRMDLKLSKYGYGVWAPFPLSMDHNMERWTTFHLNKTSVKGLYPLKLKKTRRNSIKVDF